MATKTIAVKTKNGAGAIPAAVRSQPSMLRPGGGSTRVDTVLAVLYGPPKARKTTSCSTIPNAKWIISDSNAIPTLRALGRLPHAEDTYEVSGLADARAIIEEAIEIAEKNGPGALGCSAFILDSLTAFSDWHQQDVAKTSGQRYMGDNAKNNGWQQFNAEFGAFIDSLGVLSKFITVVCIAHAKEKADASKGDFNGLNLPPQMALKMGRTANWVLYQSIRAYSPESNEKSDDFVQIREMADGTKRATEVVIHTQPIGLWIASANSKLDVDGEPTLAAEEPADMAKLMRKEGLLK